MPKWLNGENTINVVRSLIMVEVAAILVSTAVAVGAECLLYLLFIASGELRRRFVGTFKQPMVVMSMLFFAMITVGLFYGLASWEESVDFWSAWRKLLLVPLAAAVFDDLHCKQRLATFFIGFAFLAVIVSTASYLLDRPVYYRFPVGIVLYNHATQSMAFALAVFSAGILLRFVPLSRKVLCLAVGAMVVMTVNLIFITPGRSGYLAFLVFGMVAVMVAVPGKVKYLLVVILPILVGLLLMASHVARQKIELGLSEIAALDQAETLSSMGIRMVMWKNTVRILKDPAFPLLTGYGTGGFREAYRPQVAGQTGWKAEVVDDCHNQYLRILVEHGAVGLLLFLGLIGACFRQRVSRPFKILGIGALLAWCATSLFSGHFGTALEGRLIFIWLGAMLAMPVAVAGRQTSPKSLESPGEA